MTLINMLVDYLDDRGDTEGKAILVEDVFE